MRSALETSPHRPAGPAKSGANYCQEITSSFEVVAFLSEGLESLSFRHFKVHDSPRVEGGAGRVIALTIRSEDVHQLGRSRITLPVGDIGGSISAVPRHHGIDAVVGLEAFDRGDELRLGVLRLDFVCAVHHRTGHRQQDAGQDGDDGNHDQQFEQREGSHRLGRREGGFRLHGRSNREEGAGLRDGESDEPDRTSVLPDVAGVRGGGHVGDRVSESLIGAVGPHAVQISGRKIKGSR